MDGLTVYNNQIKRSGEIKFSLKSHKGYLIIVMIEIEQYSNSLKLHDGIWYSSPANMISYPSDGNNFCFDIEDQSFWFRNRNKIICEVIKKYFIDGPLFDVGGGNGYVTDHLLKNGVDSILVEPGIDGCINGKKRGLKYVINSFLDKDHFFIDRIPNIGIFDVLEHIEDDNNFLHTINNLLVPGGILFITVPSFDALWSEEDNYAGHYRRYRRKELERVLAYHGFEILYSSYFFSFLFLPVFLFRTIPSKIGLYKPNRNRLKKDHSSNTISEMLLELVMDFEFRKIKRKRSIKIGSSLLMVARKK